MKYMVMINQKYMVPVEHDGSACGAEHVILDEFADEINNYGIINGCQAFDKHDMRTEHYLDLFQICEIVSMDGLRAMVREVVDAKERHEEVLQLVEGRYNDFNDLRRQLHEAEKMLAEAQATERRLAEMARAASAKF